MGCGVSHWGEEGSVGVLDISDLSVRSGAEYARIAPPLSCLIILEMIAGPFRVESLQKEEEGTKGDEEGRTHSQTNILNSIISLSKQRSNSKESGDPDVIPCG